MTAATSVWYRAGIFQSYIQDADDLYGPTPVHVRYAKNRVRHNFLPEMWNDWYNEYLAVDFPRVLVRFEDLLFYGKNVRQTLCRCGGGVPRREHFVHIRSSAKLGTRAHGANKTGLLDALIQFGTDEERITGMTQRDLELSQQWLDPNLMKLFDYSQKFSDPFWEATDPTLMLLENWFPRGKRQETGHTEHGWRERLMLHWNCQKSSAELWHTTLAMLLCSQ